MGRLSELKEALLADMSARLVRHGFDPEPAGTAFFRRGPFGWGAFQLAISAQQGGEGFDVSANVAVRLEAAEALTDEAGEFPTAATLGTKLANLAGDAPVRWRVESEAEVPAAAEALEGLLRSLAIPYIEKYSQAENAFALLSSTDEADWRHMPVHGDRCKNALALAHVLGRAEDIERLIARSEAFLAERGDQGLEDFRHFAERIRALRGG